MGAVAQRGLADVATSASYCGLLKERGRDKIMSDNNEIWKENTYKSFTTPGGLTLPLKLEN